MNYTCRVVQDEDNRTFVIHLFLSVLVWCILTAGMAVIDPNSSWLHWAFPMSLANFSGVLDNVMLRPTDTRDRRWAYVLHHSSFTSWTI